MTRARRRSILQGLLILGLGLLAGATTLLQTSPSSPSATARTAGQSEAGPTATPSGGTEIDNPVAIPLISYDVFLARDPFQPVVPEPPSDDADGGTGDVPGVDPGDPSATPTPGDPSATPTPGDPSATPTPGDPSASPSDPDEGCSVGTDVVCAGQVVKLIDVTTAMDGSAVAVVQIGSQVFEVQAGERFADNFQVLSINAGCVTLLFGDDNFVLCEGEQVLK